MSELPWPAIGIFAVAAGIAGVLILVGALSSGPISFEAAKAGIQLFAVAILGGAVATAFAWFEEWREEQRRINAYRASVIDRLHETYHLAKSVRRTLRAAGFDFREKRSRAKVTAEQAEIFREQLEKLDEARTELEKLVKLPPVEQRVFGVVHAATTARIGEAGDYLGRVTEAWEKHQQDVAEGKRLATLGELEHMRHFREFLGDPNGENGIKTLRQPIDSAVDQIQALRLGEAR